VRDALTSVSAGLPARQYVLRITSLLGYAHALGHTSVTAGATIKVRADAGRPGANLAKRIIVTGSTRYCPLTVKPPFS